jgi:rhodanese-related sulfurtransferase/polyisoprenoid-binding protein YceI
METNMEEQVSYPRITVEDLRRILGEENNVTLIDTLTRDHFGKVHIPGAKGACVYEVNFLDQVADLVPDKDTRIVVYGFGGDTSDAGVAAEKLVRAGYRDVSALRGGIEYWRKAGYPLEGTAAGAPVALETDVSLPEGTFRVDPEKSVVEWAGRNPNTRHHGSVRIAGGKIRVEKGAIGGEFTVDMTRIENYSLKGDELQPVLIAHIKSDDFFFTELFPTAKYRIERAEPIEGAGIGLPNYSFKGELALRGIKAGLDFTATANPIEGGGISAEAHFDIDRTRWGVIYGSSRFFRHLGMHLVYDPISIQVRIFMTPVD